MKIVVIGSSGLVGSKVVNNLRRRHQEVFSASPETGVDTVTGQGLADLLVGAKVVVDVANAPSFEDADVMKFFETSSRNLLAAEAVVGVEHHIALSVVGAERLIDSGYFRAKMAQEEIIKASPIPHTILRSTQFFEFVGRIAQSGTYGESVRVPPAPVQPILSDDVAAALTDIVGQPPLNRTIEIAGPEQFRLDELVRQVFFADDDVREVIVDSHAHYFGADLDDQALTPDGSAIIGATRFEDWLRRSMPRMQWAIAPHCHLPGTRWR